VRGPGRRAQRPWTPRRPAHQNGRASWTLTLRPPADASPGAGRRPHPQPTAGAAHRRAAELPGGIDAAESDLASTCVVPPGHGAGWFRPSVSLPLGRRCGAGGCSSFSPEKYLPSSGPSWFRLGGGRAGARPLRRGAWRARGGPRSGRPPGRPERERVATGEVAWLVRRWSVRTVFGRAGARPFRRGAWSARGWVLEAADLPVGRSASAWRPARSRGSCDGGRFVPFPAEQELGRFEEERGARGGGSSKRPTSRSAGARARGDRRGRVARATVVGSYRFRPSRSSAVSKRSVERAGVGPRSGRPPGRPERERVATGEVAWLVRRWSVRTVFGRAGARPFRRGAWSARGWVLEAADLPVGRSASAWRPARSRGSCDGGRFVPFPAEQELGRFEEERGAPGAVLEATDLRVGRRRVAPLRRLGGHHLGSLRLRLSSGGSGLAGEQ
jgi:hypothetical protein